MIYDEEQQHSVEYMRDLEQHLTDFCLYQSQG